MGKIDRILCRCAKRLLLITRQMRMKGRPPKCRFIPTCTQYGLDAYDRFGFFKASWLILKRLSRCHPMSSPSYDPLPDEENQKETCQHE